jgi:hypothetical protein
MEDNELVSNTLNGIVTSRPFVQGVYARGKLPTLTKLSNDLVQDEIRF